jgi:hypothetical protein
MFPRIVDAMNARKEVRIPSLILLIVRERLLLGAAPHMLDTKLAGTPSLLHSLTMVKPRLSEKHLRLFQVDTGRKDGIRVSYGRYIELVRADYALRAFALYHSVLGGVATQRAGANGFFRHLHGLNPFLPSTIRFVTRNAS